MINSFELSGPGSSHGQTHCVVFLGETLNSTVLLPTKVYKCVLTNLILG